VQLRVTDSAGLTNIASVMILVNNSAPLPTIATPSASLTWSVGDVITFSGSAVDAEDGNLPPSALTWSAVLMHCPGDENDCHVHSLQDFNGVASGKITAPDHDYPSYVQLRLTATDSTGLTGSTVVKLQPKTTYLRFETAPEGLEIAVGSASQASPFEIQVIDGSQHSISVNILQTLTGTPYTFLNWSDQGPPSHEVKAGSDLATYTASFGSIGDHRPNVDPIVPAIQRDGGGCGCRLSRRAAPGPAAVFFLATGLHGLARRRARRRRTATLGGS
jgi:hypothetical protein